MIKNNNDNDENVNSNKGYVEKILNKDKEKLNDNYKSSNVDELIDNNGLRGFQNVNDFDMTDDNDNDLRKNKQNDNKLDLLMLNEKRIRRDGM